MTLITASNSSAPRSPLSPSAPSSLCLQPPFLSSSFPFPPLLSLPPSWFFFPFLSDRPQQPHSPCDLAVTPVPAVPWQSPGGSAPRTQVFLAESVVRHVGLPIAMGSSLTQSSWNSWSAQPLSQCARCPKQAWGHPVSVSWAWHCLGWLQDMLCLPRQGIGTGPELETPWKLPPRTERFHGNFLVSVLRKHSE